MAEARIKRKLAAILAADVVGYSRMMASDEAGTLDALKHHRQFVFNPAVARYEGRVIKLIGDGTLVEFSSIVDAVNCALSVQRAAVGTEAVSSIRLRIGVNLGDVIIDSDDIYGDGVNVAARLEQLAEPGGICIAAIVNESVGNRIDAAFEDCGEVSVKNIERPVHIWKWHPSRSSGAVLVAPVSRPAGHALPSLAVLPFQNMSGDAEQDYFADGVVEDLTTALSRFRSFVVIARNSSFAYKGRPTDVRQVARELGVRYVLEGSTRRAANRLRISAQLVDGASGAHLWADHFDGTTEDVFDVQDRITESVVALVEPKIQRAEINRSRRKRPESFDAYDLYLQALPEMFDARPEAYARAIDLLERAIALDPEFVPAISTAAQAYLLPVAAQFPGASNAYAQRAVALARRALALAPDDPHVLSQSANVLIQMGKQYGVGIALLRRAIAENPNNGGILTNAGIGALLAGDLGEAAGYLQRALRLNSNEFWTPAQLTGMAHIRMAEGRYEEALDWATRSLAMNSGYDPTYWMLIAANAYLGRMTEARKHLGSLQQISPGVSLELIRRGQHAIDPHRIEVLIEGMRLAGMCEM